MPFYVHQKDFIAEGEEGTKFEVDFTEGDWVDFDDKTQQSVCSRWFCSLAFYSNNNTNYVAQVGIYGLEARFEKTK
jgi:hypothetical protein